MTREDIDSLEIFPGIKKKILRGESIQGCARWLMGNGYFQDQGIDRIRQILYKVRDELLGKPVSPKQVLQRRKNAAIARMIKRSPSLKNTLKLISEDLDVLAELVSLYHVQVGRMIKALELEKDMPLFIPTIVQEIRALKEVLREIFNIPAKLGLEKIKPKEAVLRIDARIEAMPPAAREKIRKVLDNIIELRRPGGNNGDN